VRRLGYLRRTPLLRKVAITAHVEADGVPNSWGELHLRDASCIGIAAIAPQRANVVMVLPSPAPQIGGDRAGYFDRQLRSLPGLGDARRCTPARATGPFDWPTRYVVGDGVILVGDAAGYFDPFTGQGIYRALRSARMAAAVADEALSRNDCSRAALERYEVQHRSEFRAARALQSLIEQVTSRPALMRGAALILQRWPALAGRLVATAGDLLPPHRLLLPTPKLH
jgi:flavin-dependent dehydrogenase